MKNHSLVKFKRFQNKHDVIINDKGFYFQEVGLAVNSSYKIYSFITKKIELFHKKSSDIKFDKLTLPELSIDEQKILNAFLLTEFGENGLLKYKLNLLVEDE